MFYDIVFFLSPEAVAAGGKVALRNGEYVIVKDAATTIQAVNGGKPPADQSSEVAALQAQVAQLTADLDACRAGQTPMQSIDSFTATPNPVVAGQPTTLAWTTTGANAVTLDGAAVALSGSQVVTPAADKTYTLAASAVPVSQTLAVVVQPGAPKPTIGGMTVTPNTLPVGGGAVVVDAVVAGATTLKMQIDSGPLVDVVLPATVTL